MRDEALEDGFARRQAPAYEAAYRSFGGRLHVAALRVLQDQEAAHECVHDVFLHLWRRRNAYVAARGSLEAFLVTCVRNAALTQVRQRGRQQQTAARLHVEPAYVLEDDPIERERIERALAALAPSQADVVRMAYYRGATLAEVASDLSIPIGTVKTRLSAALRALRRSLIPEASNGA